jgi:hypothetical protein
MELKKILDNLSSLTKEQLWNEIKEGNCTLKDLTDSGRFPIVDERHKWIKAQIAQLDLKDDEAWQKILDKKASGAKMGIADYTGYIAIFGNGKHRTEADSAIAEIAYLNSLAGQKRTEKLNKIKKDRNCCRPEIVLQDMASSIYSEEDLVSHCNIPQRIVNKIKYFRPVKIDLGDTPDAIPNGFTEVYFWGIINSGKTCALSAILKTANLEGYLKTGIGPGLSYLSDLKNIFKNDKIGFLPEGTTSEKTQYLPFELRKEDEKYSRSVSLIELGGEIFQCFVTANEKGEDKIEDNLKPIFRTITSYLQNNNRKIHFFFIDYNPSEKILFGSRTQDDYMAEALKWIEKNRIFKDKTDAIYLVVTKSDMIDGYFDTDKTKLTININEFLNREFKSFRKNLKQICVDEAINNKDFEIIPFSIGDVYFTRICELNTEPSKRILNRLFKIHPQKKSVLDFILK